MAAITVEGLTEVVVLKFKEGPDPCFLSIYILLVFCGALGGMGGMIDVC